MAEPAAEFAALTDEYKRTKGKEAYERLVALAENPLVAREDPRTHLQVNIWLVERGYGKTPDRLDVNIENQPWAIALRQAIRSPNGSKIIDTKAVEAPTPELPAGDDEEEELIIVWGAA